MSRPLSCSVQTQTQAGPGFLFWPALHGAMSSAVRLNLTCPAEEWRALLAGGAAPSSGPARGGGGGGGGSTAGSNATGASRGSSTRLAPCGTAAVSSAAELAAALAALQPTHAAVLITLTANISLGDISSSASGTPTPVYRPVTLVGGWSSAAAAEAEAEAEASVQGVPSSKRQPPVAPMQTELDWAMRVGAFDLTSPPPQAAAAAAAASTAAPGARGGTARQARLVLADLTLVNMPAGPRETWPLGLLPTSMHGVAGVVGRTARPPAAGTGAGGRGSSSNTSNSSSAGPDKGSSKGLGGGGPVQQEGVQLELIRCRVVLPPGPMRLLSHWATRAAAVAAADAEAAAWDEGDREGWARAVPSPVLGVRLASFAAPPTAAERVAVQWLGSYMTQLPPVRRDFAAGHDGTMAVGKTEVDA